jgi:hypothetical protein
MRRVGTVYGLALPVVDGDNDVVVVSDVGGTRFAPDAVVELFVYFTVDVEAFVARLLLAFVVVGVVAAAVVGDDVLTLFMTRMAAVIETSTHYATHQLL